MTSQTTAVSVISCAKTFPDGTRALEPMDLEVAGGETVVLLGPSGCGKTTLLRIIAGLEMPDKSGRVLFNGEDVTTKLIEKRNVGMVFQSYALFPNMSVRDNVAYGLKVRKSARSEIEGRVSEMLEMMHINDLADRRIDQLSGGQRQRVALARAIAVRPRVLLLDEPLTALDALLRDRLRVEIDTLLRSLGITAIYVTHDQAEAMALGDRIVVMSKGKIAQIGTPRDIYYKPQNEFVADFIGTVNRLRRSDVRQLTGMEGEHILFRPEDAEIAPPDEAHFTGRVSSAFFLGDRTRLVLDGVGEAPVVIESPMREVFNVGAQIPIRIRPEGIMTLPAGEGDA
ncbi:MAG: ABC transporter ATP-binding protein [Hyphomicrobiales bacterium]|nr:MAG: ABC transporter ATP-binding protein [Hyphomicrobiales bacterium]